MSGKETIEEWASKQSSKYKVAPEKVSAREEAYVSDMMDEHNKLKIWHQDMLSFLNAKRQPYLVKMQDTQHALISGEKSTAEAIQMLNDLKLLYKTFKKHSLSTSLFGVTLDSQPNKAPSIPHGSAHDPSVLTLAALSQYIYDIHTDHDLLLTRINDAQTEITKLANRYNSTTTNQMKRLNELVNLCNDLTTKSDELLGIYSGECERAATLKHNPQLLFGLTGPNKGATAPRNDIWLYKTQYTTLMRDLWNAHETYIHECETITSQLLEFEQGRIGTLQLALTLLTQHLYRHDLSCGMKLQNTLDTMAQTPDEAAKYAQSKRLNQFNVNTQLLLQTTEHGPELIDFQAKTDEGRLAYKGPDTLHDVAGTLDTITYKNDTNMSTPTSASMALIESNQGEQTPSRAVVVASSPGTALIDPLAATRVLHQHTITLQEQADMAISPGALPSDQTIVHSTISITKHIFGSDTQHTLLYTKTHFIYLLPVRVLTTMSRNTGGKNGSGISSMTDVYDLDHAVWKADGVNSIATKKGLTLIITEVKKGWYRRDRKHKVKLSSDAEVSAWVSLINQHNKF